MAHREVSRAAHLKTNMAARLIKIMAKIILRAKAVLAVKVVNREARTVQAMVKEALVVKVVHKVIRKVAQMGKITVKAVLLGINMVVSKVDLAAKAMVKVVLPEIMEPLQTSKTVAGTAVHPTKVVNANRIKMNLIIKRI